MGWLPEYVSAEDVDEITETIEERRTRAAEHADEYKSAVRADELDAAIRAKRQYQFARYELRQADGELVWVALGHFLEHISGDDHDDSELVKRGDSFVDWALSTDRLETITCPTRVLLIVVRRFPTLPESHASLVRAVFDLDQETIDDLRQSDRTILSEAGWEREGRPRSEPVVKVACPGCGSPLLIRAPNPEDVRIHDEFRPNLEAMREICPWCHGDVYVSRSS